MQQGVKFALILIFILLDFGSSATKDGSIEITTEKSPFKARFDAETAKHNLNNAGELNPARNSSQNSNSTKVETTVTYTVKSTNVFASISKTNNVKNISKASVKKKSDKPNENYSEIIFNDKNENASKDNKSSHGSPVQATPKKIESNKLNESNDKILNESNVNTFLNVTKTQNSSKPPNPVHDLEKDFNGILKETTNNNESRPEPLDTTTSSSQAEEGKQTAQGEYIVAQEFNSEVYIPVTTQNDQTTLEETTILYDEKDEIPSNESALLQDKNLLSNPSTSNERLIHDSGERSELKANLNQSTLNDEINDATELMELQTLNPTTENNLQQFTDYDQTTVAVVQELDNLTDLSYLLNSNNNLTMKIRKCCEEDEFFHSQLVSCQKLTSSSDFLSKVAYISEPLTEKSVEYITGPLKVCPVDVSPPQIASPVTVATHQLLANGEVYDFYLHNAYTFDEYCLEEVGDSPENFLLTLAYCPVVTDYLYYDYPDYDGTSKAYDDFTLSNSLTVRKCCHEGEYYDNIQHKCTAGVEANKFNVKVQNLSFETVNVNLTIISSRIKKCPNGIDIPTTHAVPDNLFKLKNNGKLIDTVTGELYDTSLYCLELVGQNSSALSFTAAICPKVYHILPKCCPQKQYFSEKRVNCAPLPDMKNNLLDTLSLDNSTYGLEPLPYFFSCQDSSPSQEFSNNFEFKENKMCMQGSCYDNSQFCIDYTDSNEGKLRGMTFFCQTNYYVKCCPQEQILDKSGCHNYTGGRSFLTKQLIRTKNIVTSFDYQRCKDDKSILLDESYTSYLQWWLADDGRNLVVESSNASKRIRHYCIDDFKNQEGKVGPGAFVCEDDVKDLIPLEKGLVQQLREKGSLGKCCPTNHNLGLVFYYSIEKNECQTTNSNISLTDEESLKKIGITKSHYHDFPKCKNSNASYHAYSLAKTNADHAEPTLDGQLKVISVEGKCLKSEKYVHYEDFCVDYVLNDEGILEATAIVCAYDSILDIYNEKFDIVTALLAISCICLFITLIFLFTVNVRRGVLSIRKVNTLAGKILVSFVGSHFIGFLSLSLTQHENPLNEAGSTGCYILAGMIQFFNLATFCWNTSICLESFLLTIHIQISECLRYFLHSLWAWGFPAFMTALMLLMDFYKEELPCGFITPDIGVQHCFHSDDARLVYFYVPIFVTLSANVIFLLGAKALRKSRLKRLEKGHKVRKEGTAVPPSELNGTAQHNGKPANSGMRTHQTQNTKVESFRIVLWTGGTWFLELLGFITTRYILPHSREKWYDYLWYIPTSINSLRGVGIFVIIVLTPEIRNRINSTINRTKGRLRAKVRTVNTKKHSSTINGRSSFTNGPSSTCFSESVANQNRRTSVTTMITTISSSLQQAAMSMRRKSSTHMETLQMTQKPQSQVSSGQRKLSKARSISIIIQRGVGIKAPMEEESEVVNGWRRSSLPTHESLQQVTEEDQMDISEQRKVNNVTISSSDV